MGLFVIVFYYSCLVLGWLRMAGVMSVSFKKPQKCDDCGCVNFKVNGVVYNGDISHTHLRVRCMKCGKIQIELNE